MNLVRTIRTSSSANQRQRREKSICSLKIQSRNRHRRPRRRTSGAVYTWTSLSETRTLSLRETRLRDEQTAPGKKPSPTSGLPSAQNSTPFCALPRNVFALFSRVIEFNQRAKCTCTIHKKENFFAARRAV